jgi:5-formyltetrahydrofolate cyclo-ligase
MTKQELRKRCLAKRAQTSPEFRQKASRLIGQRLFRLTSWRNRKVIMCFLTIDGEVETAAIVEEAWREGKTVIVPKVEGKKLLCSRLTSWSQLAPGTFGVPEPVEPIQVDPKELELVLVPAVAFDRVGRRLGYGAGFFDRLLKKTQALRVGLAYDFQILEDLPEEANDCRVEEIITEKEIIICSEG